MNRPSAACPEACSAVLALVKEYEPQAPGSPHAVGLQQQLDESHTAAIMDWCFQSAVLCGGRRLLPEKWLAAPLSGRVEK